MLMLNINAGHNQDLMRASHALWEYAQYTSRVRKYAKEMPIAEAVERAITESIREGILRDFLEKHRTEAKHPGRRKNSLTNFNLLHIINEYIGTDREEK